MERKQINFESMTGRLPTGTMKRTDRVLSEGEKRSDLLRAVEAELLRRQGTRPQPMSRRPLRCRALRGQNEEEEHIRACISA
jgi:hypothetical protein